MNLKEEHEQKRYFIENMSEQDLTLAYERLANNGFPTKETLSFCYEIGQSSQVAYHYKLIIEDWQRSTAKRLRLETWFELHGKDGVDFLFDVLAHEPENMSVAYLLAGTLEKLSHQNFYAESCYKLTKHLEKRLPISDATERRMGIIALGWIANEKLLPVLHHHLLADSDELCRAWAASSLMQMSFNRGRKGTIRKRSASVLREAIEKETDLFALGTMIDTVQTLWDKKLGLSGIAVEERREASIQKARKSAIRFLESWL